MPGPCQGSRWFKDEGTALLDSASSASFVSERLVQNLGIPRSHHEITIFSVAGMTNNSQLRSITSLDISPIYSHDCYRHCCTQGHM